MEFLKEFLKDFFTKFSQEFPRGFPGEFPRAKIVGAPVEENPALEMDHYIE